ncbi:uncharacterized protein LOC115753474 isoform X2 [Rhodamnia argentea]|uniref:Uncharacterized protein LOC115753474 isoform X2 n=1 Tax=Rhodamnia argentea TaxID=178133 RepID=A0A8B8QLP9_9MYRT|nr:uncharacterized protein LOC115753474 isoform X2 [Rhodamnia argentea]
MEQQQVVDSPVSVAVLSENNSKSNTSLEHKCTTTTPPPKPPQSQESCRISRVPGELRRPCTPDRLKVPKAFKYPESPTDLMVSPVTKGLLARSRKGGIVLPPSKDQLKVPGSLVPDAGLFH